MIRIGLVGAWHVHFKGYANAAASNPNCKITALWDHDAARAAACAEQFGCPFVADYDALLAREDVDAVIVCTETNLHKEILIKAARAGKHIFTEKVLCFSEADALEVKKAVDAAGVTFCISFPWMCRGEYLAAKEIMRSGRLGEITYARVHNSHGGASDGWLPETFYDPEICGGGAMMDLGAHSMYLLQDLFGAPTAVTSIFTKVTGKAVEDNAVSVLEFGGLIALSETGFVSSGFGFALELGGTKATLYWRDKTVTVTTREGTETIELPAADKAPIEQWIDAIGSGVRVPFDTAAAVALSKVMQRAYESYRTGRRVQY